MFIKTNKMLELFDFIKMVFEKPEEYKKLKPYEKVKFFFMSQRFFSKAYPIQTQAFNHIKISQNETLDYWQESLTKIYHKTPPWIFAGGKKGKKETKKIVWPSDEATSFYLNRLNLSMKDLKMAVDLFGDETLEPIRRIEEGLKDSAK